MFRHFINYLLFKYTRMVFENMVLRRIFGPKRDEVTGKWRRLHDKELYAVYSSPNLLFGLWNQEEWDRRGKSFGSANCGSVRYVCVYGMCVCTVCVCVRYVLPCLKGLAYLHTKLDCNWRQNCKERNASPVVTESHHKWTANSRHSTWRQW